MFESQNKYVKVLFIFSQKKLSFQEIFQFKIKTQMSCNSGKDEFSFASDDFIDISIEYQQENFQLFEVTDYKSLCQQIEENIGGPKVQDLKITYKTLSGKEFIVKNDNTFKAARYKMKPELKLICTLNTLPVTTPLIDLQTLPDDNESQATETTSNTPPGSNQQPPFEGLNADAPNQTSHNTAQRINESNPYMQNPTQPLPDYTFLTPPWNVSSLPQPSVHEYPHVFNTAPQFSYHYPALTPNPAQQPLYQSTSPVIQPTISVSNQQSN